MKHIENSGENDPFKPWNPDEIGMMGNMLGRLANLGLVEDSELIKTYPDTMLEDLAGTIDTYRTNERYQTMQSETYRFHINSNGMIDGRYIVQIETGRHAMAINNFTNYHLYIQGSQEPSIKHAAINADMVRNWQTSSPHIAEIAQQIQPDDLDAKQVENHEGLYKLLTDIQNGNVYKREADVSNRLALKHEADNLIGSPSSIPAEIKNIALIPVGCDEFIEATSIHCLDNEYTVVHLRLVDIDELSKEGKDTAGEELISYRQTYEIDDITGQLIPRTSVEASSLIGESPQSIETVLEYIRGLLLHTKVN